MATVMDVKLDGEIVDLSMVDFMPQRDAYPGGHQYEIHVTGPGAEWLCQRLTAISNVLMREPSASEVFAELDLLKRRQLTGEPDLCWFLNTVNTLVLSVNDVWVSGICSPTAATKMQGPA